MQTADEGIVLNRQRLAEEAALGGKKVHIRVQQRKGKKFVTTVQGLNQKLNFNAINREFQRRWGCNGTVIKSETAGTVIQLQGNWTEMIKKFILDEHFAEENDIEIHSL